VDLSLNLAPNKKNRSLQLRPWTFRDPLALHTFSLGIGQ
jgi:hypothetical protein